MGLRLGEVHYNSSAVRELPDYHGFKFSKSMGQHFLIDRNIPEKIVRLSGLDESCGVLEVGPGVGALTIELCKTVGYVTTVELDKRLLPILTDTLAGRNNVTIVQGDILKLDIKKLTNENMPGVRHHVCANLPYNITTPALTAFISAGIFESITVMVQREVARRICASPGSSDYCAFSVYMNYYSEPKILFDVPPECFIPQPRVFSSVMSIKTRSELLLTLENEAMFFRIVRASFGLRRKTLINALLAAFGQSMSKEEIAGIVKKCGIDEKARGETLSIEKFAELAGHFVRL